MTTMMSHLTPVSMSRVLRVQLRIWRGQRGMLVGTVLALAVGLGRPGLGGALRNGTVTASGLGEQFVASTTPYAMLWLAIGIVASAAPFRSRWAALVLVVAPRPLRWFAAAYVSVIVWALGATALLAGLAVVVGAGALALAGQSPAAALGIFTHVAPVV